MSILFLSLMNSSNQCRKRFRQPHDANLQAQSKQFQYHANCEELINSRNKAQPTGQCIHFKLAQIKNLCNVLYIKKYYYLYILSIFLFLLLNIFFKMLATYFLNLNMYLVPISQYFFISFKFVFLILVHVNLYFSNFNSLNIFLFLVHVSLYFFQF